MDLGNVLVSNVTYRLSKIVKKKKNRWVFGAWFGKNISDNSIALCNYIAENYPEFEIAWVVRNPDEFKNCPYRLLKRNSWEAVKYVLTSRVAVFNQGYVDFSTFNFLGGTYKTQLWHGVAWKKIGYDALPEAVGFKNKLYRKAYANISQYDLFIAPCECYKKTIINALGAKSDQVLEVGQPRNVLFFDKNSVSKCREELLSILLKDFDCPVSSSTKIITYMPTFRDNTDKVFSFLTEDFSSLGGDFYEYLEKNDIVIVEKSHFASIQRRGGSGAVRKLEGKRIVGINDIDSQRLLAATDLLITDYSSCYFDFLILDRPIIHYLYDYFYYRDDDRGLYYSAEEAAGGLVAFDLLGLIDSIKSTFDNNKTGDEQRAKGREKFITYENANNCKIIAERIMKDVYDNK